MKYLLLLFFISITASGLCQRTSRSYDPNYYIGTWELSKLADKHLDFTSDSFQTETLRFTNDSVYILAGGKEYAGTWKSGKGEPNIVISTTKEFGYRWFAGSADSMFLTTDEMCYYKYFKKVK